MGRRIKPVILVCTAATVEATELPVEMATVEDVAVVERGVVVAELNIVATVEVIAEPAVV